MLEVDDIVADPDMMAPQPFSILRSVGTFVQGGFQSITSTIYTSGPVQPATDKDVAMLPEADHVGGIMAFWSLQPIYTTRGKIPLPSTTGVVPNGAVPGTVYVLNPAPPDGVAGELTVNGLLLRADIDYKLVGDTLTLAQATPAFAKLYFLWPTKLPVGQAGSDILVYNTEQYRVLSSRQYPGSRYWKALGTRLSAV